MGSVESERKTTGLAARDPSGTLAPYTYDLRSTGPEDAYIRVICCGICHSDLHQIKNDLGMAWLTTPWSPGTYITSLSLSLSLIKLQSTHVLHQCLVHLFAVCSHEVVGEVLEVGSEVTGVRVGDRVGVGVLVGCCRNCMPCKSDIEQYCSKKIWSYNDVYTDGKPTHGGFAGEMVVDQKFMVKIPEGMSSEQAAPLLCAGVTVYSPLNHFGLKQGGLRGGILGLGGVGHMGSSDRKREEALDHLGADAYLVSSDEAGMKEAADSLDYIIDTVPVFHPLEPYLSLLKLDGKLILLGVINTPLQFFSPVVMSGRKVITGSFIGSMKETKEMLDFCEEKGITSQIEVIKMDYINTAFERLEKNDVRYRFVVDVAGSKLDGA
ncbi:hypothetical protein BT93_G0932 [Corymbia citriodora subsp. variegata]|nr:hypothetical protein BT93_G0932 [Corymbia citriodora subsp. variegata]